MEDQKTIKVVSVLDDDLSVVINKGSNDGIRQGQKFLLYEIGREVFDPDTRESLGKLEVVKGTGVITHVQEKMATLTSDEFYYETEKTIPQNYFSEARERKVKHRKAFLNPEIGDLVKKI